ncbi:hypothetical protein A6R70_00990 [Agrobacterium rubi]|nr:hypothetical protein [Agrobacterium rubi]
MVMRLIDCPPGDIVSGSLIFEETDLLALDAQRRRELTVGRQFAEVFESHSDIAKGTVQDNVIKLLERVGILDAKTGVDYYPH